jgi:hypothetical protein
MISTLSEVAMATNEEVLRRQREARAEENQDILKRRWAERATERQKKAGKRDWTRKKRERKMRAQGLKTPRARKRVLHFRFKWTGKGDKLKHRLYLCYGGITVAAWPLSPLVEEPIMALIKTKMLGKGNELIDEEGHWSTLCRDQRKIMTLVRRLRKALLMLEDGPRGKSISRQRRNLDIYCKFGRFRVKR